MPFFDEAKRVINFKIVYYGPGMVGKTTNMRYVYDKLDPATRTQQTSFQGETERALFFDFRPSWLVKIQDRDCRIHLYTVPGPVFYDTSRVRVLKEVDGVIFVADSQDARAEANIESLEGLESNLAIHGYDLDRVPMVLQYNKRDLPDISSPGDMDAMLNPSGRVRFETVAWQGSGVFETLRTVTQQVLDKARKG